MSQVLDPGVNRRMIQKKYRLKEREVKKVLHKGKPFFSYSLVFNVLPNTLGQSRFAIVISSKSVPSSVVRNMYRRMFYEQCRDYIPKNFGDIVCVIKAKTQLKKDALSVGLLQKEIHSILNTKLGKST